MKTQHYSKEFRLQAARLVVEQRYSYAEVAQRLGPSAWSVREWVAKQRLAVPQSAATQAVR